MAQQILIDKLLMACVKQGASDMHITVGQPPVFRLHGRLRRLETKVLEPDDTVALMKSITPERCQQELQEAGASDFGFAFGDMARFRVSIFKQRGNVAMVLRQIPNELLTPEATRACARSSPRLMHAAARSVPGDRADRLGQEHDAGQHDQLLNENVDHHIITIEDPIEFYHYHKKSTVNQREIGVDVPSFAEAIRRALRQDPDVILVGEMRDLETIEAAITAAETGHVVFGTLHTTGAQGTVNRIIDVVPDATSRTRSARSSRRRSSASVAQQLLPKHRRRPRRGLRDAGRARPASPT